MATIASTLSRQFGLSDWIVDLILPVTTNAVAMRRGRGGEGASVSWTIGHCLSYRILVMNLLGAERANPYEIFRTAGADENGDYPDISQLHAQWQAVAAEFGAFWEKVSDDLLLVPMPTKDGPHAEKQLLDSMVFFAWHEAHHLGCVSMIRAELGEMATAKLAMASMKK